MTHAFSGERRVPLQPWQMRPFYTGKGHVRRAPAPKAARPPPVVLAPLHGPPLPTMELLTARFAKHYALTVADLRGPSRSPVLSHHRQALWSELLQTTSLSLTQIGRYFGRDHSTVSYGADAHAKRMAEGRG